MPRAIGILTGGTAAVTALLGLSACGNDPAQQSFGKFTDCSTIGKPVVTNDPAGDQRRSPGATIKAAPQGDLLRLRVAKTADRLCVEFRANAPIRPYAAFVLTMRPQDADVPVAQLESTVLAGQAPDALLDATSGGRDFRKIKATVGIKGDRLSVLVGDRSFADQNAGALFESFRFQARTAVAAQDEGRLTDCMPVCE